MTLTKDEKILMCLSHPNSQVVQNEALARRITFKNICSRVIKRLYDAQLATKIITADKYAELMRE